MIRLSQRATTEQPVTASVTLPIEKRVKSRQRVTLDDGRDAGIILKRGEVLQHGDKLSDFNGEVIEIIAAQEKVSMVYCLDPHTLARACYHLGNRHVPVEIIEFSGTTNASETVVGAVSYLHDHVLDDMLRGLGLSVEMTLAPFNPEPGAYGGGHAHHHEH